MQEAAGIHLEKSSLFLEILLDRACPASVRRAAASRRRAPPLRLKRPGLLRVTDGSVESKVALAGFAPFFPVHQLLFGHQRGTLFLTGTCEIAGPAVFRHLLGEVKLNDRMSRSLLNITAHLTPGAHF